MLQSNNRTRIAETVKKLIQQFEIHPDKESFLQDLDKTEEIIKFSEESQKLTADMNGDLRALRDLFQKSNAPNVIYTGRSALSIAPVEDVYNRRKELRSGTTTTTMSYQFQAMLSKNNTRGAKHGRSERQRLYCKACQKRVNPIMEDINPYLRDGTKTTNTESLCQKLGGPRSILLNMTRLPWKTTHTSQQNL